jgi:[ribosomal protein S5]-alanine N-acetyltransferase
MSSEDLKLICRPFTLDDYEAYLWVHQNQLPSQHPFDEGYFPTQGLTVKYFKSLVEEYNSLSEDRHAFIMGAFDVNHALVGIGELISLNDEFTYAQIKIKVFNLYFNQGYEKAIVKQLKIYAKNQNINKLVAYVSLQDETAIKLYHECGFDDEGAQMIAECDQVCWPTKQVFTYQI